jgi:uncharacterized protein DUF5615
LYANENFPLPTVEALRQLGHDVQTSQDAGRANRKIPDEEVLEYAKMSAAELARKLDFQQTALHPSIHPSIHPSLMVNAPSRATLRCDSLTFSAPLRGSG